MPNVSVVLGSEQIPSKKNLLIVGDCYSSSPADKANFAHDTSKLVSAFGNATQFPQVPDKFRVWKADTFLTAKHQTPLGFTGSCAKPANPPKARFGTKYSSDGSGSCHYLDGEGLKVASLLTEISKQKPALPAFDYVLVLVNYSQYGGMAHASYAWVSAANPDLVPLALHEVGHLFGLNDEYEGPCGSADPPVPANQVGIHIRDTNVSTDPVNPLWRKNGTLTEYPKSDCTSCAAEGDPTLLGSFQGGQHTHCRFYRPYLKCRMRDIHAPFCVVCEGVIAYTLDPYNKESPIK